MIFLDETPDFNANWSVKSIIAFSNLTGVGEALDGDTSLRWFGDEWDLDDTKDDENSPKRIRRSDDKG